MSRFEPAQEAMIIFNSDKNTNRLRLHFVYTVISVYERDYSFMYNRQQQDFCQISTLYRISDNKAELIRLVNKFGFCHYLSSQWAFACLLKPASALLSVILYSVPLYRSKLAWLFFKGNCELKKAISSWTTLLQYCLQHVDLCVDRLIKMCYCALNLI